MFSYLIYGVIFIALYYSHDNESITADTDEAH